jgi:hypothetical protein
VPVIDLDAALDPVTLSIWIEFQYAEHAAAIAALMERNNRFLEVTAKGIADDFIAGHAADFAKDLKGAATALDETRTRIKRPVLHAQRMIDGAAKNLADTVTSAVREVEGRITEYLRVKEVAAREAAEREAARLAAEAEAAIVEAQASGTVSDAEVAMESIDTADKAAALASAPALELTRTRGAAGALTGLREVWTYSVEDIAKVPTHLLQVNDAAVRLAIKQGAREVPGLRIFAERKAMIR